MEFTTLGDAKIKAMVALVLKQQEEIFPSAPTVKHKVSSKMFEGEKIITGTGWKEIGNVVSKPEFFNNNKDTAGLFGRAIGEVNSVGLGAQMRILEKEKEAAGEPEKVIGIFDVPDTAGLWKIFRFSTVGILAMGTNRYKLEANLGTASNLSIRFSSMSLLKRLNF